jgi:hypothetical protein
MTGESYNRGKHNMTIRVPEGSMRSGSTIFTTILTPPLSATSPTRTPLTQVFRVILSEPPLGLFEVDMQTVLPMVESSGDNFTKQIVVMHRIVTMSPPWYNITKHVLLPTNSSEYIPRTGVVSSRMYPSDFTSRNGTKQIDFIVLRIPVGEPAAPTKPKSVAYISSEALPWSILGLIAGMMIIVTACIIKGGGGV